MPFLNTRKYSKSELILKLNDPKTKDKIVNLLSKSHYNKLPAWIFKTEKKNKDVFFIENMTDKEIIENFYKKPKSLILKTLMKRVIKEELIFDCQYKQTFYYSLRALQLEQILINKYKTVANKNLLDELNNIENQEIKELNDQKLALESKLLNLMHLLHEKDKNDIKFLRNCLIRFDDRVILTFINSFTWNLSAIIDFLCIIKCKMLSSVIQLWFNNSIDVIHSLFRRLDSMKIDYYTEFNQTVFNELIKYKTFKKALFNSPLNKEWIMSIKEVANRSDFSYYYRKNKINRTVYVDYQILPRDFHEFSFFDRFVKSLGDILKIRRYQTVIGHSLILHYFINDNLDALLSLFTEDSFSENVLFILTETVKFNFSLLNTEKRFKDQKMEFNRPLLINEKFNKQFFNENYMFLNRDNLKIFENEYSLLIKQAEVCNEKIFDRIKLDEDKLRPIVHLFSNPTALLLNKLLYSKELLSIDDALGLINQGFETDLFKYFSEKPIESYISLIDDWTVTFFLKLFLTLDLNEKELIFILKFLNSFFLNPSLCDSKIYTKNSELVHKLYNKIFEEKSDEILLNIPERLKYLYCLGHKEYFLYFKKLSECTLVEASQIHELYTQCMKNEMKQDNLMNKLENNSEINNTCNVVSNHYNCNMNFADLNLNDFISSNFTLQSNYSSKCFYTVATSNSILFNSDTVINSLFLNNFILKKDSYFLFCLHFDMFFKEITSKLSKNDIAVLTENKYDFTQYFVSDLNEKRIAACLKDSNDFDSLRQISFIMQFNLNDKYTLFILFEKLYNILMNGTSNEKIFVLNFIDSTFLSKNHILKFIDCIIPMLNCSNRTLSILSKIKFAQIDVDTKEIQNIMPLIVQCFEGKGNFIEFYNSFVTILFNNYLCFNSLNIIIQVLFKYIETYTKECLNILSRIINITKDKDIKHISSLVFTNISRFVVNNNFYTKEALDVVSQFCLYATIDDFDILIKNNNSLRICNYLVGILKVKGDSKLNNEIIEKVIKNKEMNKTANKDYDNEKLNLSIKEQTENELASDLNSLYINQSIEKNIKDSLSVDEYDKNIKNTLSIDEYDKNIKGSLKNNVVESNLNYCVNSIEPSFIAAACELPEFNRYLSQFIPVIKDLFQEASIESRKIACKAIKSIFEFQSINDSHSIIGISNDKNSAIDINDQCKHFYGNVDLKNFLISMSLSTDHNIRLSVLEVLDYLPIIYILRNDNHTLVKKKAYDIWKERVSNTNKELKCIYKDVLSFLKYYQLPTFSISLKGTVIEMVTKYCNIVQQYIEDKSNPIQHKEFILIEASKLGKLVETSILFCKENNSPELFKNLFKNKNLRDELIENTNKDFLIEICMEDNELPFYLFNKTNEPIYIDFLSFNQKMEFIKNHYVCNKTVSLNDENLIFILQSIESSFEIEQLLVKIHPSFSYFYLSVNRVNYGLLNRLFERVFDSCYDVDELINEKTVIYLKNCSFERVKNKKYLLMLLIKQDDRRSFDRVVDILKNEKDILNLLHIEERNYTKNVQRETITEQKATSNELKDKIYENDDKNFNSNKKYDEHIDINNEELFKLLGFLLRNYLSKNRRTEAVDCIVKIYDSSKESIGFFKDIIEDAIINK